MPLPPDIRVARTEDAAAVRAIYASYVRDTVITLEEAAPDVAEMARRMALIRAPHLYLVADADGGIAGYAYAGHYNVRSAYRWTAETTIYLDSGGRGRGLGRRLYGALLAALRARGFMAAIAGITLPNAESAGFHEAMGFRAVGRMTDVGYKFGRWWDVGYWQLDLAPRPAVPEEPQPR